ncbi:hypothetical protein CLAIMM_09133 [Cladophialophora immunda]|nr:hypothetical protein CLAIMM_09133 [Cladophialophora immunda]
MDAARGGTESDGLLLDQNQCPQYGPSSTNKTCRSRTATLYTSSSDETKIEGGRTRKGRRPHGRLLASLLPGLRWITKYRLEYLSGDLMGAMTVAAIYAPLSVSFALAGHAHPTSGMVSFIVCTLIYALLGQCPQMIIGPEAPGSLLVGIAVRLANKGNNDTDADPAYDAQLVGAITATAGTILLVAGLTRLGFVSCILNRPFVRGFILALGVGVVVEQTIPALGLTPLVQAHHDASASRTNISIASKFVFILENLRHLHLLSALVSISSFALVMTARSVKTSFKTQYPRVVLFPDRLLIVFLAAFLTYIFQWQDQGLEILGSLRPGKDTPSVPIVQWPFQRRHIEALQDTLGTCLTLATTGLFESILTIHTLRKAAKEDARGETFTSTTNQELVALGTANAVAGCFNALPSFGGYGRSKLNVAAGGRTPMSSVLLSLMIATCLLVLLPAFHYVPKCVLAALLTEVGVSMIEECPSEVAFFLRVRGWSELSLMALVVGASVFVSLTAGLTVGVLLSLLRVVRSATQAGVSLYPPAASWSSEAATENTNVIGKARAHFSSDNLTVVTITGPLTFTSSEDLERRVNNTLALQWSKTRRRVWGRSSSIDPLADQQVISQSETGHVILFNFGPSATIDNCVTQTLLDIVQDYSRQGMVVRFFSASDSKHHRHICQKLTLSGNIDLCGGPECFFKSEQEVSTALEQIEQHSDVFHDMLDV